MSSSSHSRWLVGEESDDNEDVDHGEDQDLGDNVSQGDHERGGEDELEEDINWRASAFYIGKFFTKQPDSTAKCNTCKIIIKTKLGNTTGLDSHLMRKHSKVYELYKVKKAEVDSKRAELKESLSSKKRKNSQDVIKSKQSKLEFTSGVLNMKPPPPNPQVQKEFVDAVTNFAVESGISFNALAGPGFQNVVNVLNKHSREKVKVLDRKSLANHVSKAAAELLKQVTSIIKSCKNEMEGVAFTTDIWTSPTMESFISLTVHWVDQEWYLHRWTPYVRHFPDRHTGSQIKIKIDHMIERLELDTTDIRKYVVNDNDAAAVLAIKLSPDLIQVRCAIHTLQLSVGDTFKEASVGPTEMKRVLTKGKCLANTVKKSGPLAQELKNACKEVGILYTTLKNPNETRWNSSKTNMDSIIKLEKALNHLVSTDTTGQWTDMVYSPSEWRLVKAGSKILEIPLRVTKAWEGEKYPTMNLMCSELYKMKKKLEDLSSSSCKFTSEFATVLSRKVERRFPNCAAYNDAPAIANYIDPVFKGVHIEALGAMEITRGKIRRRWRHLDDEEARDISTLDSVPVEENEDQDVDPTALLLRARKRSGDQNDQIVKSKLQKEMEFFESNVGMEELKADGDRLEWWKEHQRHLPLLSKVAREVLGIPCSSAKSERVFSTGGFMVTKKRCSLGAARVESLLVLKENKKLVDEFHRKSNKKGELNVDDAFEEVVVVDEVPGVPPPLSERFDDGENEGGQYEDSSDDEFEVVIHDKNRPEYC